MKKHGITIADYTAVHGRPTPTKMSYHQCRLCRTVILFTRVRLANHLTRHKVSVRDYGNNYLKKIRSENVKNVKIEDIGDVGEPGLVKKTYHESDMTSSAYKKSNMQLDKVDWSVNTNTMSVEKGRKVGTQKIPQWCDGTMYKCPFCFTIYYRYFTFRIHLINSHKMTDTEERSICVRENEILTDIYRCKICTTQVKRDRMDIEAHLKQAHKTTLKIYSANFENINVKESAQEMVEKLVRMGVLEEPTKSLCRTPKKLKTKSTETPKKPKGKVIETPPPKMNLNSSEPKNDKAVAENDTKFVTVSENVDANGDEENQPRVKTEVYDAAYLSQSSYIQPHPSLHADIEIDAELSKKRKRKLSSRLSSDFEVGQVESLTPKRSKDFNSKKLSKTKKTSSTSSSPLSQRNANTQHQTETADQQSKVKVEVEKTGAGWFTISLI